MKNLWSFKGELLTLEQQIYGLVIDGWVSDV